MKLYENDYHDVDMKKVKGKEAVHFLLSSHESRFLTSFGELLSPPLLVSFSPLRDWRCKSLRTILLQRERERF